MTAARQHIFILTLLIPLTCFGQKNKEVFNDTSIITTNYYKAYGYIAEFNKLKKIKKTYFRKFDYKTKKLIEEGVFLNGYNVGLWKYYSNGTLEKTINYDNGQVEYFSKNTAPFANYFDFIKTKADSILIKNYGADFFKSNIRWNASGSYYYAPGVASVWFEKATIKPKDFVMRYDVLFGDDKYPLIEFKLDSIGNINYNFRGKGIIKCKSGVCTFNVDYNQAIQLAKSKGLKLNDTYVVFLKSISCSDNTNDYELIVADYYEKEKENNRTYYYYNTVVINPWTGEIKETAVMSSLTLFDKKTSYNAGQMYKVTR